MSQKQIFTVVIETSEKMPRDEDLKKLAKNIGDAISHAANTSGITPESTDGFTERIEVTPMYLPQYIYTVKMT